MGEMATTEILKILTNQVLSRLLPTILLHKDFSRLSGDPMLCLINSCKTYYFCIAISLVICFVSSGCSSNRYTAQSYEDLLFNNNRVTLRFFSMENSCDKVGFLDSLYKGYFRVGKFYKELAEFWSKHPKYVSGDWSKYDFTTEVEETMTARMYGVDSHARKTIKKELESISGYVLRSLPSDNNTLTDIELLEQDIAALYSKLGCTGRMSLPKIESN